MRLGTFLYQLDCAVNGGEIESIEKALEILALKGLSYIDLGASYSSKFPSTFINNIMKDNNMTVGSMYWISDFKHKTPDIVNKSEDEIKKNLDYCASVNCKIFMPVPMIEGSHSSLNEREECRNVVCDYFNKIAYLSKPYGIQTVFENFSNLNSPFSTIEDCEYLINNTKDVKYVLDAGNFWFAENDALKACKMFLQDTVHVHLKDLVPCDNGYLNVNGNKADCVAMGDGVIPISEIVKELTNYGYNETLTIELNSINNLICDTEKSLEYLKKLI